MLADKFQLTENERGDILRQLFMQGDNSRYGLVNAVTAVGKIAKSYERATELERIDGEILSLPVSRNLLPPAVDAYQEVFRIRINIGMKGGYEMSSYFNCAAYDDVEQIDFTDLADEEYFVLSALAKHI